MINNPVYNDNFVRGEDLQHIVDAINNNELFGDQVTTKIDKGAGGTTISVFAQYGGGGGGSGGGDTSVFPCIVTTVSSTSIFAVKLSDPTGTPFLVVPLSYQDTNLSAGNVIMATEYTAVTL